jgi:bifunctional DNA primase/polymerase-like protein
VSAVLRAALEHAADMRPVFFLASNKGPLANCAACRKGDHHGDTCAHLTCHGHLAATTDPERLRAMHRGGRMLGLRTGAVSGLVVVDVDPRNGGRQSWARLAAVGLLPRTAWVATGSDGAHFYYRHPGRHVVSRALPGYPGIDIKGDGGYVVLPPSVHPDTDRAYQWRAALDGLVEMHPGLSALVCRQEAAVPAPRPAPATTPAPGCISAPDRLLASILARVLDAPESKRRVTLWACAQGVARMVAAGAIGHREAVAALEDAAQVASARGTHRLTAAQIRNAITDGFRREGVAA